MQIFSIPNMTYFHHTSRLHEKKYFKIKKSLFFVIKITSISFQRVGTHSCIVQLPKEERREGTTAFLGLKRKEMKAEIKAHVSFTSASTSFSYQLMSTHGT